jgi:hypothetical protein
VWLPEYGVGLIGMANVTYAGLGGMTDETFAALSKTGALQPRVVQPAAALVQAKADVSRLITNWDDALAKRIAADNLFLDTSAEMRAARFRELAATHGACSPDPGIDAENALRGTWRMTCDRGRLDVTITLAPTDGIPNIHQAGVLMPVPSLPAVKVFDDRRSYYDPANPLGSVITPVTGTLITVQSWTLGSFMQVEVRPAK